MWTVVHIATGKPKAEMIRSVLENEGVLVKLRPVGIPHPNSSGSVEVLVPESEAREAYDILSNNSV